MLPLTAVRGVCVCGGGAAHNCRLQASPAYVISLHMGAPRAAAPSCLMLSLRMHDLPALPSPPPLSLTHVPVMTSCFVSMLSLRMVEMEDNVRKRQAHIAALSCT